MNVHLMFGPHAFGSRTTTIHMFAKKPKKTHSGDSKQQPPLHFNSSMPYNDVLVNLREDFNKRWGKTPASPENGIEGYFEIATLGAGSFGRVILVKKNHSYAAVKIFIKNQLVKTKQVTHVHTEKMVLAAICFPFVINLEFSAKDFDCLYLGMPFVNGGELFTYHRKVRRFNEKIARFYAAQILLGLEYLHFLHFVYRDLKPENILIGSNGYIKMTDFGFTKKIETRTFTLCGTPEYMAPEIIQSQPYGASVDWWSYGIFIYELVAGYSPFSPYNNDDMTMYQKICDCDYRIPKTFSAPLRDLVQQLLQVDITKRFGNMANGVKDIKDHAWFDQVHWFSLLNQQHEAPYIPNITSIEDVSHFQPVLDVVPLIKSKANCHPDAFKNF